MGFVRGDGEKKKKESGALQIGVRRAANARAYLSCNYHVPLPFIRFFAFALAPKLTKETKPMLDTGREEQGGPRWNSEQAAPEFGRDSRGRQRNTV